MLRVTKNADIVTIKWFTKEKSADINYEGSESDSFLIIPGVTNYNHIYSKDNWIVFDGNESYLGIEFKSIILLERYFVQLITEIKLNQIINVSVDVDTKSK